VNDRISSTETWAIVGLKDDSGAGKMSFDLTRLLFPARRLVTPSSRMLGHPIGEREAWIPDDASDSQIEHAIEQIEVLIVLEDSPIHHRIIRVAKDRDIKVHALALWEWFSHYDPIRKLYDKIICPNKFCYSILRKFGFYNTVRLTWPVDIISLPERMISGPARTFVHNAGRFGKEDRKGTLSSLEAFCQVRNQSVSLIVRSQNSLPLRVEDRRIHYVVGNLLDYHDLYREGEVFVQPSKAEGIGFSILEPIACGLPVLTTDYPPMNEYIRHSRMLVPTHRGQRPAQQKSYVQQAHLKIPRVESLTRRIEWCARNDMAPFSRRNRKWALQNFNPDRLRTEWIETLRS
jgi:glycosyltransferase involved in cell wall biosynthesis